MLKNIQKRSEGFTIIEVLIVLAIAGLIMVVVFIAVPNLQRTARNEKVDTEASALVTAYGEVSNQKGGAILTSTNTAGTPANQDNNLVYKAANLGTTRSSITSVTWATGAGGLSLASGATATTADATFRTGAKCADDPTANAVAGTTRQAALIYVNETAGGTVTQCRGI